MTEGQLRLTPGAQGHDWRRRAGSQGKTAPGTATAAPGMAESEGGGRRGGNGSHHERRRSLHQRPGHDDAVCWRIVIFGIMGYRLLPVSDLPNVDFPTIQVTAALPGASPDTMASAVATPLEKQFSTIAGITSISSTQLARAARSITLQFDLDRNIDAAAQDVQSAIARGRAAAAAGHADAAVVPARSTRPTRRSSS